MKTGAIVLLCSLVLCSWAYATTTHLVATIDGDQANMGAGTGSPGTGSATLTYDDATNLFSWDISWSGLSGSITLAHFHGPASMAQNAGVQVDIGGTSGLTSPSIGSATLTNEQATDLLNELWYINIHTTVNGGGEIRGQVLVDDTVPVDAATWAAVKALYRR